LIKLGRACSLAFGQAGPVAGLAFGQAGSVASGASLPGAYSTRNKNRSLVLPRAGWLCSLSA